VIGVPAPITNFVGRGAELAELVGILNRERLVTLHGPPGVGKTRLAIEAVVAVAPQFAGGIWWVDLTATAEPEQLIPAVARALRVHEHPGGPLVEAVVGLVGRKHLLLVLDNCEHLIDAVTAAAQSLLEGCPGLNILATSRQPLTMVGERRWMVNPLSLPGAGADPDAVSGTEAGELFCARAGAISPTFSLRPDTAPAVAEICRRLDGIPLAIELAAARLGVLAVEEIAARLDDRFKLLGGGSRAFWGRHQTLAEALAWSYELLVPEEQCLLRRLGVFCGAVSLDTVEAVCAGGDLSSGEILNHLSALISKSLVAAHAATAPATYQLLETVRAYAVERLAAGDERADLERRYIRWYRGLAEQAEDHLTTSEQPDWLERLDASYNDLHAALALALEEPTGDEALRLAAALCLYWRMRGRFSEGRRWLEAALARPEASPALRAKGLWALGFLDTMLNDFGAAEARLSAASTLYRRLGDERGTARALLLLGNCRLIDEGPAAAVEALDESAALARDAGDPWCLAHALALAGNGRIEAGDLATARSVLDEGLAVARSAAEPQGLRIVLSLRGRLALIEGDHGLAERLLEEGLGVSADLRDAYGISAALVSIAEIRISRGQYAEAQRLLEEGLRLAQAEGPSSDGVPLFIFLEGRLALEVGNFTLARALFEKAQAEAVGPYLRMSLAMSLGEVALAQEDLPVARPLLEDALQRAEASGRQSSTAGALHALGALEMAEGRMAQAEARYCQALALRHEIGDAGGVVESLEAVAALAAEIDNPKRVARLLGAAFAQRQAVGYARSPRHEASYCTALVVAKDALATEDFEAAWGEGERSLLCDAVDYAGRGRGRRPGRPAGGWEGLTPSEREVARLVAEGLDNSQIAARRFVSVGTVKKHVGCVFAKLGVSSRVEVTREALRRAE